MKITKINLLFVCVIILLCFSLFLIILNRSKDLIIEVKDSKLSEQAEKERKVIASHNILLSDLHRGHLYDANSIPEDVVLLKTFNLKDSVFISKIDLTKPKLVFRFSDISCHTCIDQEIGNLKVIESQIGIENILILGSFENNRKAISFSKLSGLDRFNFYSVDYRALNSGLEEEHLPFLFILDQSMSIKNLFIPHYQLPTLSTKYYNVIKKKYFYE